MGHGRYRQKHNRNKGLCFRAYILKGQNENKYFKFWIPNVSAKS